MRLRRRKSEPDAENVAPETPKEVLARQHLPFPCSYDCGRVVWRHPQSGPMLCWQCWRDEQVEAINYITHIKG